MKNDFDYRVDKAGSPPEIPSLVDMGKRYNEPQLSQLLLSGKVRMPGFPSLESSRRQPVQGARSLPY
jgi:hypothetical protein